MRKRFRLYKRKKGGRYYIHDEATGKQIIELLFRGHRERGTTLVLVTHDTALAARCGRVVRLRSGRIEAEAEKATV